MNRKQLRARCRPHLWFQLYWVVYLIWFFWLDLTITDPKYIIHSRIDDRIPFNEWFIFPYCSWFLLLAGVTALLWWCDTQSYGKRPAKRAGLFHRKYYFTNVILVIVTEPVYPAFPALITTNGSVPSSCFTLERFTSKCPSDVTPY